VARMHTFCSYCNSPAEKLKCNKCRSVVYCNSICQKANLQEHKLSCKPCVLYITAHVNTLHKTHQWRKLLKWSPYLDGLLEICNEKGKRILLSQFKQANQMGSNQTNDPIYSLASIPILLKSIELNGKAHRYEAQGTELCELGQAYSFQDNDAQEIACYLRACEIGDEIGVASVKCAGNLGLGRVFALNNRVLEAKPLLRLAFEAAQLGDTFWMKQHAVICADELCDILFRTDSIDEVGSIVTRFPKLLKKSLEQGAPRLQHYHMRGFILMARFLEAKNRPEEAVSEIYKMLSLIEENKEAIHDMRPLFLHLIDQALKHLRVLDDTDVGNFELAKKVYMLRDEQRRKDPRWWT
jgi:hypothetical protein